MKIFYTHLIALSLTVTLSLTAGCGEGGTETGNPQMQDEGDDSGGEDTGSEEQPVAESLPTTAEQILSQICTKLTACFDSLDTTTCNEEILQTDNIDDDLGLTDPFESYLAMINAEIAGTIMVNSSPATTCLTEIDALACTDQTVQSAYSESNPGNFNNIQRLVPDGEESCEGVY